MKMGKLGRSTPAQIAERVLEECPVRRGVAVVMAVVAGMVTLLAFLLFTAAPWTWLAVWSGNFLIFILRHKTDLRRRPDLRAGVLGRFFSNN